MAKFSGYLKIGSIGAYLIDDKIDYVNKSAMVVDTLMSAGMSLFKVAEINRRCHRKGEAEENKNKACWIMNTLYAWKEIPAKRPSECATSWLDDAWCTLHQRYEEYVA